jgi:hypothetical protein
MLEKIYETIRGILFYKMPKNAEGHVVVYDHVLEGWHLGDRDVLPSNLSIIIYGSSENIGDAAFGMQEIEHRITIGISAGSNQTENSEKLVQELARLVYYSLKDYRVMWIMDLCPICQKWALTPEHFTNQHNTILSPFVTAAQSAFSTLWAETHSSPSPAPLASGIAADAFLRMYEAVRNDTSVTNLTEEARLNIKQMQKDLLSPIRLIYGVKISEAKPSDDGRGQQLLKQGQFTLTARELVPIVNAGPDSVPIEAV